MSIFAVRDISDNTKVKETKPPRIQVSNAVNHMYMHGNESSMNTQKVSLNTVDKMLDNEVLMNKAETWNKLDNTMKMKLLNAFADTYSVEQGYTAAMTQSLKQFFSTCLEKNKLQRSKDVLYNKNTKTITSIPALYLNTSNQQFTLKIMDNKRVSTLKSLTPIRKEDRI